jgi:hypothetical protein
MAQNVLNKSKNVCKMRGKRENIFFKTPKSTKFDRHAKHVLAIGVGLND